MSQQTNKSVSEKMAQLGKLVAWFESDEFTLEDAIEKFREAEARHVVAVLYSTCSYCTRWV